MGNITAFPVQYAAMQQQKNKRFSAKKYLCDTTICSALKQMFDSLPFLYRFVLLMAYFEELEREDISFVLAISPPAVDKLLANAKNHMLSMLRVYTKDLCVLSQFPKMISRPVLKQYFLQDLEKISQEDIARVLQNVPF